MNFKNLIILVVAFIALILFQREFVMPLVYDVVKSDAFLTDTEDTFDMYSTETTMTEFAHMQCNRYISDEFGEDVIFEFAEKPTNAWALGGYNYLINSELLFTDTAGEQLAKKYVCRIKYNKGSDDEGIAEFENWSVNGISGLDGI